MKSLEVYINEKIKELPKNVKGLIVFDIDDTLLKVDSKDMCVYKKVPGSTKTIKLSTEEFAKDEDAKDPSKKSWFDLRDFNDPIKVYNSIISGTPLIRNIRIMDDYIQAGYDVCFLTARGCEEVIKKAITSFLKLRDEDGSLKELGNSFKTTLSHAVNDDFKKYPGKTDADKKANVLRGLCKKYDKVVFVDDDSKNIIAAKELNIKNLKVIKAWTN